VRDGSEDLHLHGVVDPGETDPVAGQGADDVTVIDSDGDGLSDGLEETIGSDPNDADSDDDGVPDGEEPNPSDDHDGDGLVNAIDPDSDGDGLFDGTETGRDCASAATDVSAMQCRADADAGATTTSAVNPDTDFGGKPDGAEDENGNGTVDGDETDPLDPGDDGDCVLDRDCGAIDSGLICVDYSCEPGCRGQEGNACPEGQVCSSTSAEAGVCEEIGEPLFGGGGCNCRLGAEGSARDAWPSALLVALGVWFATRRRRLW
jgi:hypothetical protein